MDELTKLAIKYGTDKWGKHHYTPVYYEMFNKRRMEIKKVLEIGSAEGAGLFMYRDFFPNAKIYGAEIDPARVDLMESQDNIWVIECDQSKVSDLSKVVRLIGSDIDIVIDDGSHVPEHQYFSCQILMQMLDKGVTYIIEDVAQVAIASHLSKYNPKIVEVGSRYDDRLIICQK